jgi:hypothetical protein
MERAAVSTRFGPLPANDSELNGDYLQVLVRLALNTGNPRFLEWARRIGDAYVNEVLPGHFGLPSMKWDFEKYTGDGRLRLRDHGNELVVGLTLLYALEETWGSPRAVQYRSAVQTMLDRILVSSNPDGLLYNMVQAETLVPVDSMLSDNWGYVYGAVYTFYQATGEIRYRDAVRRVLANLPKYRNHDWERGSFDGYADAIESALYLVNREPVPQALDWIESETRVMLDMQKPSGLIEHWYGEGNFNRTLLLYADLQSQGCRPDPWEPGVRIGAVRSGERLFLHVGAPENWKGRIRFDFPRHRRIHQLPKNFVRLNEFPEWYTVDGNTLYALHSDRGENVLLGAELIQGVRLEPGLWTVEPYGKPPYGHLNQRKN